MPFASFLDLQLVEMSTDLVVGVADWTPEKTTAGGALHGGYLMGCVDAVGAIAAFNNLPAGSAGTTTIESKTNTFCAVRAGTIRVRATPVHIGRTTIVVQTDVLDDHERLVSRTTQTQLVLGPNPPHRVRARGRRRAPQLSPPRGRGRHGRRTQRHLSHRPQPAAGAVCPPHGPWAQARHLRLYGLWRRLRHPDPRRAMR